MKVAWKEFNNVIGMVNGAYHEAALKMNISDSERDILYILAEYGSGCNQSALYKETGMTRSTVNSAIRKMEREGLVYLTAGEGRNTCVIITDEGREYMANTIEKMIAIENRIYEKWNENDHKMLISLMKKYAEDFTESIQEL